MSNNGYEEYFDYSAEFEEFLYTRATPEEQMAFEIELEQREARARGAWRSLPPGEDERFRRAAGAVRRLRAEGKGAREIMAAFRLRDPASIRRLEAVLDWLEAAGTDPRAAALAALSKRAFLAVVSRGILTVDELRERSAELSKLPAFSGPVMSDIRSLLATSAPEQMPHQ